MLTTPPKLWGGREAKKPTQVLPGLRGRVEQAAYPGRAKRVRKERNVQGTNATITVVLHRRNMPSKGGRAPSHSPSGGTLVTRIGAPQQVPAVTGGHACNSAAPSGRTARPHCYKKHSHAHKQNLLYEDPPIVRLWQPRGSQRLKAVRNARSYTRSRAARRVAGTQRVRRSTLERARRKRIM